MFKIYTLTHRVLKCVYVRVGKPKTNLDSKKDIFAPLRNCLTKYLTTNTTPERRKIYEWLKERNLLLLDRSTRGIGWTDGWVDSIKHDGIEAETTARALFDDVCRELEAEGYFLLNSRQMH